ncbi:MAG: patatin-like phospholipase family protein [Pseudomonadota bacterium]
MAKGDDAPVKRINLALQGGGAHGAFTWGVLDRLLEDPRIEIDSITGASAGAMNAVVLAEGLSDGGCEEARRRLKRFWAQVGEAARHSPVQRSFIQKWLGGWSLDTSPGYLLFDMVSRVASPYDLNPLDLNPLRDILVEAIDFKKVCECAHVQLFISATNVETGQAKVFDQEDLTADHVMASACLPLLYKAVWIDGKPYWDGGYMGNPPLWPLFDHAQSDDVVIVQINPMKRPGAPRSARDILNRLNEITFNASLMRELRAVDFVTRLMEAGRLENTGYRRVLTHIIGDEESMAALGASSKLNAEQDFLDMLFERGRSTADEWLAENFDALNNRSSFDLASLFGGEEDPLDGDRIDRRAKFQAARTKRRKRSP